MVLALMQRRLMRILSARSLVVVGVAWTILWVLIIRLQIQIAGLLDAWAPGVYLGVMNNWVCMSYVLFPAFAYLIVEGPLGDVRSGYAGIVIARASRTRWALAELGAMATVALVYQVAFALGSLAIGAIGATLQGGSASHSTTLYPALAAATPVLRVTRLVIFETFAFVALGSVLVAAALRVASPRGAVALTVTFAVLDWVLSQRVTLLRAVSPARMLLEGIHVSGSGFEAPSWGVAVCYFAALMLVGVLWAASSLSHDL